VRPWKLGARGCGTDGRERSGFAGGVGSDIVCGVVAGGKRGTMKVNRAMVFVAVAMLCGGEVRAQSNSSGEAYKSVVITSASDIAYPPATSTTGLVAVDVGVDASGNVQNVKVVQDVPPLTDAVVAAVKKWSFGAAQLNGSAVAGRIRVNVVFNPFNPGGVGIPSGGLQPEESTSGAGIYAPARVTAANYATYPVNTVASGAVVLDLHVGKSGKVEHAKAIRGVEPLTSAAIAALQSWKLAPATYEGKAVGSRIGVAFVFASPALGTQ
jgi:TonB family protein